MHGKRICYPIIKFLNLYLNPESNFIPHIIRFSLLRTTSFTNGENSLKRPCNLSAGCVSFCYKNKIKY